ncbi:HD domain-containing protein [Butyrivibrio sp.]|uniref:HD domain-containing protein n=1 Tax=Butyrivibrio sp. TaxID=28121 RepID=UPI0025B945FD|nr:HD domain-containing protein [Butyrivibrio sp.]
MMYPTIEEAKTLLIDAEKSNPGQWVSHSRTTAHCAEKIAQYSGMNAEKAYVLGLLHDIGRKFGVSHLRHVSDGYKYMMSLGYDDVARICLTHSFNQDKIEAYVGNFDASEEDTELIRTKLKEAVQDDYDKLIQLCDAIAGADGVMDIIDRMSDVKRRYGSYDPEKWQTNLHLKMYFEDKMGMDLYTAVEKDTYSPFD